MNKLKNIAVAVASIVIFTNVTHAQVLKANYSVNYQEPLTVKYLGSDDDYLTFEVTVQPQVSGSAFFAIADKNEGELYTANLASNFNIKTVKIEKRDNQVLDFKLVVGKNSYSKSFSVNTNKVETTTVLEGGITML